MSACSLSDLPCMCKAIASDDPGTPVFSSVCGPCCCYSYCGDDGDGGAPHGGVVSVLVLLRVVCY